MSALSGKAATEAPWLEAVLETVTDFGEASLELVAWELSLPEATLASAWDQVVRERLVEHAGECRETGELLYRLAS